MTELGIVAVRVEQGSCPVCLGQLGVGDRRGQPPVVGLAGQPEHPARHRHRHPVRGSGGGQLADERVHHFAGRFACDRYAAALLSTSFSCSSNRIRLRASRSSADSPDGVTGVAPSSVSARRSHFDSVIGWPPKSAAICSSVTPGSRLRATRTTSSRNSFGYGLIADLYPGEAKTDARDAYVIADAARTMPHTLRAIEAADETVAELEMLTGFD